MDAEKYQKELLEELKIGLAEICVDAISKNPLKKSEIIKQIRIALDSFEMAIINRAIPNTELIKFPSTDFFKNAVRITENKDRVATMALCTKTLIGNFDKIEHFTKGVKYQVQFESADEMILTDNNLISFSVVSGEGGWLEFFIPLFSEKNKENTDFKYIPI